LGAMFVVLSPVQDTSSHLGAKILGWEQFNVLVEPLPMPVYALGGLGPCDISKALSEGACGVSGVSGFYSEVED